ncbi:MAG: tetratricopeptide repeat protein [Bacteroidales bacterium]|jgi:tetratricopeptide (TPR) repeat protein|nr:tetratricopeptide repeat protein [Bacteroidales bacterium]
MSSLLNKIFILSSLLLILSINSFAQEKYMRAYEKEGDYQMEQGEYETALKQYLTARKFFVTPLRIFYKCGEACRMMKDYDKAEYYYQKVITENDTNDLIREFPFLHLHLAEASISNGNLFSAKEILDSLLAKTNDNAIIQKAKHKQKSIEWILDNNKYVYGNIVENLGKNVNNESSQTSHFVLNDSLLFISSIDYKKIVEDNITYYKDTYQQLYTSKIDSNSHTPITHYEVREINKKRSNVTNISFDILDHTAYFTLCSSNDNQRCIIYYSEFKEGKYQKAKKLNKKINLRGSNNSQPNIGIYNNEKILYFSSNREGGYGGYDLYYYVLDGKDNEVINLGPTINTEGDEITPFYSMKDNSLYFSSNYHLGFGGFDIFQSEGWATRWTTPQNLLQPINSPANDIFPVIVEPDEKGYLTSNREGSYANNNKTCCNDIYSFEISGLPEIPTMLEIKSKSNFSPVFDLPLQLFFHNDQPNPQSNLTTTKIDYQECYKEYKSMSNLYKAEATRYINDSTENIIIDSLENFFQIHIDKGMNKLNHMCDYLYQKLLEGEKIDISIIGYSSSLHNNMYNYALSERRIGTIINYMSKWEEGKLKPFLSTKANDNLPFLNIKTLAMGKLESKSENPKNAIERRKSIYKIDAMYERRIEIRLIEIRK